MVASSEHVGYSCLFSEILPPKFARGSDRRSRPAAESALPENTLISYEFVRLTNLTARPTAVWRTPPWDPMPFLPTSITSSRQQAFESNARTYPRRLPLAVQKAARAQRHRRRGPGLHRLPGRGRHARARAQPPGRDRGHPQAPRRRPAAAHPRPDHAGQGPVRGGAVRHAAAGVRRPGQDPVLRAERVGRRRGGPEAGQDGDRPARRSSPSTAATTGRRTAPSP